MSEDKPENSSEKVVTENLFGKVVKNLTDVNFSTILIASVGSILATFFTYNINSQQLIGEFREQERQALEEYFVYTIDGDIYQRLVLSQYFANVSSDDESKENWENYYQAQLSELTNYINLKKELSQYLSLDMEGNQLEIEKVLAENAKNPEIIEKIIQLQAKENLIQAKINIDLSNLNHQLPSTETSPVTPSAEVIPPQQAVNTDLTIEYFSNSEDPNKESIIQTLSTLGFGFKVSESRLPVAEVNAIWFGNNVPINDVKAIAYALVKSGQPIKVIRPFNNPNAPERISLIQVGSDRAYLSAPILTVEQIQNTQEFLR